MDNLNDPQGGNIIPGRQGDGGDSSKWNCVPFVSVVGIAALRTYYTTLFPLRVSFKTKSRKPKSKSILNNLSSMHPVKEEDLEKNLLVYSAKQPLLAHLEMEEGLSDIFKNDHTCAEYLNTDKRKNGSLMWLYLKYWKLQLTLQLHKKAEAALLNTQTKE
uniref:Coiled-coil domain containing 127b n=1 Tax=Sinocyclocheilus grahami TaxID=75366 RepID=A0A672L2P6_SINGR